MPITAAATTTTMMMTLQQRQSFVVVEYIGCDQRLARSCKYAVVRKHVGRPLFSRGHLCLPHGPYPTALPSSPHSPVRRSPWLHSTHLIIFHGSSMVECSCG